MRMLKPRPVDDIVLGVACLVSVALHLLFLAGGRPWWQTTLAVLLGAGFGVRWLWQGMRAWKADRGLPG